MAKKSKKAPTFQYGIEITKPFSVAMYNHNDLVAANMKLNILQAWKNELAKIKEFYDVNAMADDWNEYDIKVRAPKLLKIQRGICSYGYGEGYTMDMVNEEFLKQLDNMANWQLHEEYSYLSFENNIVPRTRFMMVGFEWQKHDYSFCTDKDLSEFNDERVNVEFSQSEESLIARHKTKLSSEFSKCDEIEVPCSAELDQHMANESENIQ